MMFGISESGNTACSRVTRERSHDTSDWAPLVKEVGSPSPGQLGCRKGTHARGLLQGLWVTCDSAPNHITSSCLYWFCLHPGHSPTYPILFPMFTHLDGLWSPWNSYSTILPSLPKASTHPTLAALSFTAMDMDVLVKSLVPCIWLIINPLPQTLLSHTCPASPCCPRMPYPITIINWYYARKLSQNQNSRVKKICQGLQCMRIGVDRTWLLKPCPSTQNWILEIH